MRFLPNFDQPKKPTMNLGDYFKHEKHQRIAPRHESGVFELECTVTTRPILAFDVEIEHLLDGYTKNQQQNQEWTVSKEPDLCCCGTSSQGMISIIMRLRIEVHMVNAVGNVDSK